MGRSMENDNRLSFNTCHVSRERRTAIKPSAFELGRREFDGEPLGSSSVVSGWARVWLVVR
jgi:hypothetical protein